MEIQGDAHIFSEKIKNVKKVDINLSGEVFSFGIFILGTFRLAS